MNIFHITPESDASGCRSHAKRFGLAAFACVFAVSSLAAENGFSGAVVSYTNAYVCQTFDGMGRLSSLREVATGRELVGTPCAFVAVKEPGGRERTPIALRAEADRLVFVFGPGETCALKVTPFDGGWTFESVACTVRNVAQLTLARVLPSCNVRKGGLSNIVEDDDSAVVVRAYSPELEMNETAWNGMNEAVPTDRETYCRVNAEFGFVGWRYGLSAGPRREILTMLKGMAQASGLVLNRAAGPWSSESEINRHSYLFATWMDYESLEDWIRLVDKAGCQMLHFHAWWKTRGHYEPDLCFPGGLDQMREAVRRVHAAGKRASTHTLAAAVQFGDPWIAPPYFDDYVYNAHYTLARPFHAGDDVLYVNEQPIRQHSRILTGSTNGNVLRIGDDLVQYSDFFREKPYRFTGIRVATQPYGDDETYDNTQAIAMSLDALSGKKRSARRLSRTEYPAGTPVGYIHQRCSEFLPRPGTRLADAAIGVITNVYKYCGFDGIYLDGSEIWGTRYNIDKVRYDTMARLCADGSSVFNGSSCRNPFDWWMRSIVGSWDHPIHGVRAFHDRHIRVHREHCAADYNQVDLGWWNTRAASKDGRGYFPEEMEYFGCKSAANDMTVSIIGAQVTDGPLVFSMDDQLTISGWWSAARFARAFKPGLQERMRTPGEDWRLRQDEAGRWTVRPLAISTRRLAVADAVRWTTDAPKAMPAELRVEALYGADAASTNRIRLLDESMAEDLVVSANTGVTAGYAVGTDPQVGGTIRLTAANGSAAQTEAWAGFVHNLPDRTYIEVNPVSSLWVKGDGSGAYLNVQVRLAPEFSSAFSENFIQLDFTGWRRIDLLLRERDSDLSDCFKWPYEDRNRLNTPSHIFRRAVSGKAVNGVAYWLNGIPRGKKVDIEVGAWDSVPMSAPRLAAGSRVTLNGLDLVVPFGLASGEWAELKGGSWWHYAENGEPLARIPSSVSPALVRGSNVLNFRPAEGAPFTRTEVTVFGVGVAESAFAALTPAQRQLLRVEYELPNLLKPSVGLSGPFDVRVRPGERAQLGFEILGPAKNPVVMGRRIPIVLKDAQDRVLCEDGCNWKAVRIIPGTTGTDNRLTNAHREALGEGSLADPLPVLPGGVTKVSVSSDAEGARVTLFKKYLKEK